MAAKCNGAAKSEKPLLREGEEEREYEYYDIMMIGKTGVGKSTTVDKLLTANIFEMSGDAADGDDDSTGPTYDHISRKITHRDLVMWMASAEDRNTNRLKNLLFARNLKDPHREIDRLREDMDLYKSTSQCELLSNESTRIRVLDIPGFFGEDAVCDDNVCNVEERAQATVGTDLSTMRKIIRITKTHNLNFRRIVYFLPDKGVPKRVSQNLKMEIAIMEKYFGRSIFDSMVVVATRSSDFYEVATDESKMNFSDSQLGIFQDCLQKAIQSVFKPPDDVPKPPIISISLFDTCEHIFQKIQKAPVKQESIQLAFKKSICTRCGIGIYYEARGTYHEAQDNDEDIALCSYSTPSKGMLLDESTCHPIMVPKYTTVKKIVGGIFHLITFRRFLGRWPSFESKDEVCLKCNLGPGKRGCTRVGDKFEETVVTHTSEVIEPYEIKIEEDEEELAPQTEP